MRILRINSLNGPAGGVEEYIRETNDCLKKMGNEVLTVEINSTGKPGTIDNTINIYVNGKKLSRLFKDVSSDDWVFDALMNACKTMNPDIIHIHHFRVCYMSIVKFLKSVKIPCVYTAHDAQLLCPISTLVLPDGDKCDGGIKTRCMFTGCSVGFNVPYEMLRVWAFKHFLDSRISAYICPSKEMKLYMEKFKFSPSFLIPSYPDLNVDNFEMLKFPSSNNIGYLGRLDRYKGVQVLIKALKIIKTALPDVNLQIAGTGDYSEYIKSLSIKEGVSDNVEFLGHLGKERHREFFSSINFLVIPSLMIENIVFTAQEAFSFGRPVVASRVGGIPEIVKDNFNGLLVHPNNEKELAEKISILLKRRDLLMNSGKNAYETIKTTVHNQNGCNDIQLLYERIISQEKGSS